MISMSEKTSQLNYSDSSYKVNLQNGDSIIEEYQYSITGDRALESVLSQNYSFIPRKECIGISIDHIHNGSYLTN